MNTTCRRQLLKTAASLAALLGSLLAAMGPADKFDLLIRNANVMDPSQGLSGKRDIGIRYGLIEAIEPSIGPRPGAARDGRGRQAGHAGPD